MRLINDILYLETAEWVAAGLNRVHLSNAKAEGWGSLNVINDPVDQRAILIEWQSIKNQRYRQAIIDTFGDPLNYYKETEIKSLLTQADDARSFFRSYVKESGQHLTNNQIDRYTQAASWLKMLVQMKSKHEIHFYTGISKAGDFWNAVCKILKIEKVALPKSYPRLIVKVREFEASGFEALIDGRNDNASAQKVSEDVLSWLIRKMAASHLGAAAVATQYEAIRTQVGWPQLSVRSIEHHLNAPDIKQVWYRQRKGDKAYFQKYGRPNKLARPAFSNDLWAGDGTMFNLYFFDPQAKGRYNTMNVYVVSDGLSEVFLGHSLTEGGETFNLQMKAFRMALKRSSCRPYQLLYDNQKGHKKQEAQRFYDKLAEVHFATQAYRPSGKPIEGLFGRFQKQILAKYWFWTGYGRHTHSKADNAPNLDYVRKHADDLPTKEEVILLVEKCIEAWNEAEHPQYGVSRNQVYLDNLNPESKPLEWFDMADLFWNETGRQLPYRKDGLSLHINGVKELYEVYTSEGEVDFEFRQNYLGAKFTVKYDPEMPEKVLLYQVVANGDMRFIAVAERKKVIHRSIVNQPSGEMEWINKTLQGEKNNIAKLKEDLNSHGFDEQFERNAWRSEIGQQQPIRILANGQEEPEEEEDFDPVQYVRSNM